MTKLSEKIIAFYTPKLLSIANNAFNAGAILSAKHSEGLLKLRVKDDKGQLYDVHVNLREWPDTPIHCQCSERICVHGAIALLWANKHISGENIVTQKVKTETTKLNPFVAGWLHESGKTMIETTMSSKKKSKSTQRLGFLFELVSTNNELCGDALLQIIEVKKTKLTSTFIAKRLYSITERRIMSLPVDARGILFTAIIKDGMHRSYLHPFDMKSGMDFHCLLQNQLVFVPKDEVCMLLTLGEPKTFSVEWRINAFGDLTLISPDFCQFVIFDDRVYLYSSEDTVIYPLILDEPLDAFLFKITMPSVLVDTIPLINKEIKKRNLPISLPTMNVQTPSELQATLTMAVHMYRRDEEASFIQHLTAYDNNQSAPWHSYPDDEYELPVFYCTFFVEYDGVSIFLFADADYVYHEDNGNAIKIPRRKQEERELFEKLAHYLPLKTLPNTLIQGEENPFDGYFYVTSKQQHDELENITFPSIKKEGYKIIELNALFPKAYELDSLTWVDDLDQQSSGLLGYQIGVMVEDKKVPLLPIVVDLLSTYSLRTLKELDPEEKMSFQLSESTSIIFSVHRLMPLIDLILMIGEKNVQDDGRIDLSRYQMALLQEIANANIALKKRWMKRPDTANLMRLFDDKKYVVANKPASIDVELRPYQQVGVNWLQTLRQIGLNGVLADDMGLGKTVQTLVHFSIEQAEGRLNKPSLIVAPTSLVMNWFLEANRFVPSLRVKVYHGNERKTVSFDAVDLVITTYGIIQREKQTFLDTTFYYVILDEAQSIKNSQTKTTQIIYQLNAMHRLCLTGTPLENHLGELWSLFHFLMPGLLGDKKYFQTHYRQPIEKNKDLNRQKWLSKLVKPFMLRRTKKDVLTDLPAKVETIRRIEIEGAQRDLYEAIRISMEDKVREVIQQQGLSKSHIEILDALLKLRQVCCDPRLLKLEEAKHAHGSSAKLDALMTLVETLVDEGRRILIFSQFTSMLALIEESLNSVSIPYLKLTGSTVNRQALVDKFQTGDVPIFLISLKAGGTGLNLTKADTVIHYDPWWNPAAEDQATDRTHRIGQTETVFVYKFITLGTVEEVILGMQDRKRALYEGILSENSAAISGLTEADVVALFQPLKNE
jgi:SNF2 family DNA or RNA helicase